MNGGKYTQNPPNVTVQTAYTPEASHIVSLAGKISEADMSHLSEEQWQEIGSCPDCDAPLYLMGDTVKYHDCTYDRMSGLMQNIRTYSQLLKDIDTMPLQKELNRARRMIRGKTL